MDTPINFPEYLNTLAHADETKHEVVSINMVKAIAACKNKNQAFVIWIESCYGNNHSPFEQHDVNQAIFWCFAYGGKLTNETLYNLASRFKISKDRRKKVFLLNLNDYESKDFKTNFIENMNARVNAGVKDKDPTWTNFYKNVLQIIEPLNKHYIVSMMATKNNIMTKELFNKPLDIFHPAQRDTIMQTLITNKKTEELKAYIQNNKPWAVVNTTYVKSWKSLADELNIPFFEFDKFTI